MAISATANHAWPSKTAYISATIFIAASGGTNVIYGWQRGAGDTAVSIVWAGVSLGVAIIFALSWPALIKSLEARRWSAAIIAFIALLLSGSYSVTAALGSAAGGRTNAATAETATTDARKKAQAAYDTAKGELDGMKPSRPAAEVEALVEAAKPVCKIIVQNGSRDTQCTKPPALTAELGRAKRKIELEAKLDAATADLKANAPARVANSDAKALSRYLAAAGIEIGADRLNDLLVLLAVLMIEAGGGLSIAIGMALSTSLPTPATTLAPTASQSGSAEAAPATAVASQVGPAQAIVALPDTDVLAALRAAGGRVESIRRLSDQVGRPRAAVTAECKAMVAAGVATMARGRHGMAITLKRAN